MEKKQKLADAQNADFLEIVGKIMFVYGDSNDPLTECNQFVHDLVKFQLVKTLEDAYKITLANKLTASSVRSLSSTMDPRSENADRESDDDEDMVDSEVDPVTATSSKRPGMISAYDMVVQTLEEIGLNKIVADMEKLNEKDSDLEQRQLRMVSRTKVLSADQYQKFADARQVTFTPNQRRRANHKASGAKINFELWTWLGQPPVSANTELVLRFIAREVVAMIVDDAVSVKIHEAPNFFVNKGDGLQMRHYEEALRRNIGYRHRGDFLFGYY